jgi:hypothetical protein
MDIFIIAISIGLSTRFEQLNQRIVEQSEDVSDNQGIE